MSLRHQLNLKTDFTLLEHEAILNVYFTASIMKKRADEFFKSFGITDVQFNVLMLLNYQAPDDSGLSQAQLSKMMLVNRANITSLVDRMEKSELVARTADPQDRRYNIVKMTPKGKDIFTQVEPLYTKMIKQIMTSIKPQQQKQLIYTLEQVRSAIDDI